MRLTVPGPEYLWLAPLAGLFAMMFFVFLTAVPDPSRVGPPPHVGRYGRTIANGGIAMTPNAAELIQLRAPGSTVPAYLLDFAVTVENRHWARDDGFAFDLSALSLEGTGTGWRRSDFRSCAAGSRLMQGESTDAAIRFVLDGAPAGKVTLALKSERGTLALWDVDLPPARQVTNSRLPAPADPPLPPVVCRS
jgi:hypothetical protein